MADPDRHRVYLCEDRLARWAASAGPVVVDGRLVTVEPEHTFADLASTRLFCTLTCLELGLPPVTVRRRQGETESHYDPSRQEIALASWGGRRLVVLHELAHHLARHHPGHDGAEPDHGPLFRRSFVDLLAHVGLPRQSAELRRLLQDAGLALASAAPTARDDDPGGTPRD